MILTNQCSQTKVKSVLICFPKCKYIEQVDTTKFLGILIDNNLTWKAYTSHVTKIVSEYNGIIRKVRPFLNSESLHTLYNTLILPYLTYCTIVWGDKNNSNLNSLFITQKKIVRTCTNSLWLARAHRHRYLYP